MINCPISLSASGHQSERPRQAASRIAALTLSLASRSLNSARRPNKSPVVEVGEKTVVQAVIDVIDYIERNEKVLY
jgi:hypothetical protein